MMRRHEFNFGLLFALLLTLSVSSVCAEYREFKNASGETIEAELLELSADQKSVEIRMRDGRKVTAALTAFSSDDRKYIRKWWQETQAEKELLKRESRIEASMKLNRKSKGEKGYYYVDKHTVSYFPQVTVINDDALNSFTGNTVRGVVLAEDKRYEGRLLVASAFEVKSDFERHAKTLLDGTPFNLREEEYRSAYDSAYNWEYGYEYCGYILVIKNSKGEVVFERATRNDYLSKMELVMNCKSGEIYDADFNSKLNLSPSSSHYTKHE